MGDVENPWRIDEAEFDARVRRFIFSHIRFIIDNEDKYDRDVFIKLNRSIREFKKKITKHSFSPEIRDYALNNIILKDVYSWRKFSASINESVDDIILKVLMNKIYNNSFVCLSLEQTNVNLPHEAWKDISFIISNVFSFDKWDSKHVNAYYDACVKATNDSYYDLNEDKELLEIFTDEEIDMISLQDLRRGYWKHITEGKTQSELDTIKARILKNAEAEKGAIHKLIL